MVLLGDMGVNTPLLNILLNGTNVVSRDMYTANASIVVRAPLFLNTDSIINTNGGDVSLEIVNAATPGEQSLTIFAGTGNIGIKSAGTSSALSSFSILSGGDGVIVGEVITQGGDIKIVPSLSMADSLRIKTFSNLNAYLSGDVILGDVVPTVENKQSLTIDSGLSGNIVLGNLGTDEFFLDQVTLRGSQLISLENVFAESLSIKGASSTRVFFNREVVLENSQGLFMQTGPVTIGASITAPSLYIQSQGSILNGKNTSPPINIYNSGPVYLEVGHIRECIGASASPLILNAQGFIEVGGTCINIAGDHSELHYLKNNRPCFIAFHGQTFNCKTGPREIFRTLPGIVQSVAITRATNPLLTGNYPDNPQNHHGIQRSQFGPLDVELDRLGAKETL